MARVHLQAGYSFIELMAATALLVAMTAIAIPQILAALDDFRTLGAVRYMASRLQQTRMEAVSRNAHAAMRFEPAGSSYTYAAYLDGNRNGVRSQDIQNSVDRVVQRPERLANLFVGVDFRAMPGLPPIEASVPPGSDPIRFGSSNMVTFTPLGTSSSGSLYIRGRRSAQYAIRVFGATGKTRILKFSPGDREWRAL